MGGAGRARGRPTGSASAKAGCKASAKTGLFLCPEFRSAVMTRAPEQHWGHCSTVQTSIQQSWDEMDYWVPSEGVPGMKLCETCQQEGVPLLHPEAKKWLSIEMSAVLTFRFLYL